MISLQHEGFQKQTPRKLLNWTPFSTIQNPLIPIYFLHTLPLDKLSLTYSTLEAVLIKMVGDKRNQNFHSQTLDLAMKRTLHPFKDVCGKSRVMNCGNSRVMNCANVLLHKPSWKSALNWRLRCSNIQLFAFFIMAIKSSCIWIICFLVINTA